MNSKATDRFSGPCIGIDLGTTTSCVGIYENGRVEIIVNEEGYRTTPSYVSFNENERLIGDGAKSAAAMSPENTVFDAKRLIGRHFSDPVVQSDMKYWPFKVVSTTGDKPGIQVDYLGERRTLAPEEISAMVLTKMKAAAETYLGVPVHDAVITVPAYFSDSQRLATKDAGRIAGLKVHRIINEPTAAALAYGFSSSDKAGERNVLVFDLGGGTFDVSVLAIDDGAFEVLATHGDTHLGGEDFDNRVVEFLVKEFEKKHKVTMRDNPRAMRRLRTAAERAKRTLSAQLSANVEVDALFQGLDFKFPLTRAKFEELNADLFRKCLQPVEEVLRNSKLSKSTIHEVVLVGGSTRIPKIRSLLQDFFNGKELCMSINPDEAVAYGAAVQAAILSGQKDKKLDKVILMDIAPLSLGIETAGGVMATIVPHSTGIPCAKNETFSTAADNQPAVDIKIFEGNRSLTAQNHLLGNFTLSGIAPAPRGTPKITVTFNVDANGILDVTATDSASNNSKSIRITNDANRLSDAQVKAMQEDAIKFAEEDKKIRDAIEARNKFSELVYRVETALHDTKIAEKLSTGDKEKLEALTTDAKQWIDDNVSKDLNEINERLQAYEASTRPLLSKIYEGSDYQSPASQAPFVEEVE